ncbi:alpha/beta family hydrolase [Neptuniibacter halophilus]|uniref:alpha/beta family hydrolase n=1 Tax=Neptuniibacter halophilus TaxID=651666 RepID=UPI002572EC81|nr:alpha/beta family hydrolase [Neptuniibacter halophilus]
MDSDFMQAMALGLADLGCEVIRFEFPYMAKSRAEGKRRPPDRMPKLLEAYTALIEQVHTADVPLFLAGKSMGGRVASMLLEASPATAGLVFGYPFHPRGKPDQLRTEHLLQLQKPLHIFQGSRDPMGSIAEVSRYNLPASVNIHWLEDGDHDLKPRKASGFSQEQHILSVVSAIAGVIS